MQIRRGTSVQNQLLQATRDGAGEHNLGEHHGSGYDHGNPLGGAPPQERAQPFPERPPPHDDLDRRHHRRGIVRELEHRNHRRRPGELPELRHLRPLDTAGDAHARRDGHRHAQCPLLHRIRARRTRRRRRVRGRLAVLVLLGTGGSRGGHSRREDPAALAAAVFVASDRARTHDRHDRRQSHVRPFLCRIRVLVRLHQGGRHHRVHRHCRLIRLRMDFAARRHLRQPGRFWGICAAGRDRGAAAVPTVFFAMTGAEITTVAAAESAQPERAVARMGAAVTWRILVFYVASIFLIVSVTPWNNVRSGESPFTLALNTMQVPWAGEIMSVIILTAVLSCLNSAFYVSSRVLFILADRRDAPKMLVTLNSRRVPVVSVLMGAVAGFLGIIAATEAPQKVFDFLVSSSGALIVYVYMTIAVAQIALRTRRERSDAREPPVVMWLFPWLSYAAIAAMAGVLIAMAFTPGSQQDFKASAITLAVAIVAYLVVKRLRRPQSA